MSRRKYSEVEMIEALKQIVAERGKALAIRCVKGLELSLSRQPTFPARCLPY